MTAGEMTADEMIAGVIETGTITYLCPNCMCISASHLWLAVDLVGTMFGTHMLLPEHFLSSPCLAKRQWHTVLLACKVLHKRGCLLPPGNATP